MGGNGPGSGGMRGRVGGGDTYTITIGVVNIAEKADCTATNADEVIRLVDADTVEFNLAFAPARSSTSWPLTTPKSGPSICCCCDCRSGIFAAQRSIGLGMTGLGITDCAPCHGEGRFRRPQSCADRGYAFRVRRRPVPYPPGIRNGKSCLLASRSGWGRFQR